MKLTDLMVNSLKEQQQITNKSQNIDNKQNSESFDDMLSKAVDSVANEQINADEDIKALLSSNSKNIHEVMINLEKADISLKLMTKVRDKVIDAYREMMRMNVWGKKWKS